MYPRYLFLIGFAMVLVVRQNAKGQDRDAVKTNPDQIKTAIKKHDWAKSFSILPWDQMRAIDGPEDRVHGLASLVDCNFTYAGFPRVEDLPTCEKLGLKAIVFPDKALGLTKRHHHLTDAQIENAIRTLADETKDSPACVGYFILDEPGASEFADLGKIVAAI